MATVGQYEVSIENKPSSPYDALIFNIKKGTYTFQIYLSRYPTNNCQLSCIGSAYVLAQQVNERADAQAILKECYKQANHQPRIVIMDVRNEFCAGIEKLFCVFNKNEYTSTNGSHMCLYMIKLDN
jgi:hypothetical protein